LRQAVSREALQDCTGLKPIMDAPDSSVNSLNLRIDLVARSDLLSDTDWTLTLKFGAVSE